MKVAAVKRAVVVALFVALVAPTGAQASGGFDAPWAGTEQRAWSTVLLKGADGWTLRVTVDGRKLLGNDTDVAWVQVDVESCKPADSCTRREFLVDLDSDQFSLSPDLATASVVASFSGAPLKVAWERDSSNPGLWSDVGYSQTVIGPGGKAKVTASLFGVTCKSTGDLTETIQLRANGYRFPSGEPNPPYPPITGLPGKGKKPACAG